MIEDIRGRLERTFAGAEVDVSGEGNRFQVQVVAAAFDGLGRVQRQQAVYAAIGDLIESGAIHAVTIRALTPAERTE